MANWFYYDANGTKKGPVNNLQLKALANSNHISENTILETETGRRGRAGNVKGLFSPPQPNPDAPASPPLLLKPLPKITKSYCTCCGCSRNAPTESCVRCGADTRKHRNYCRYCGTKLGLKQDVCPKCGGAVKEEAVEPRKEKNRIFAVLLAWLLFGPLGSHWFYLGRKRRAVIYLVWTLISLTTVLTALVTITAVLSFIDGIRILNMSNEEFWQTFCYEDD
ncbi:MAG: NINE protein [Thermoguttaceae bacterium]